MSTVNESTRSARVGFSLKRALLDKLFSSAAAGPAFEVDYWDGHHAIYGQGEPRFIVTLSREPETRRLFEAPSLFFGEAYMRGDVELSGSPVAIAETIEAVAPKGVMAWLQARLAARARSLARQKRDIERHYDLGNDFFSLWLDKATMSYSCAYFTSRDETLDAAQEGKIALVLRKLRLSPGMRLLEIGCGWGSLALPAARHYGVRVLALTLSAEQARAVSGRIADEGLGELCEVRRMNYLELDHKESFDRIVSVGMFEHVGKDNYPDYFNAVRDLLKPGGLSLLHTLDKMRPTEPDPWISRYIFPGGRVPVIPEIMAQLSRCDFSLVHVESLRRHYVRTLETWWENFNRVDTAAMVRGMFGQTFVRMWNLYLRMAAGFLASGLLDVHQYVFTKGPSDDIPMTLEDIYAPTQCAENNANA
jgi:cyclopropane-fatty-acyl-phospholipid synthase